MSEGPAVTAALREADEWIELVDTWREPPDIGVEPREAAVVRFFDPAADLTERMERWGFRPGRLDLSDVALFGAGLAKAESDAWRLDTEHIATQAYSERRFLLGDRLLHWAVPWLRAAEATEPVRALASQQILLGLGERHRPAPLLADGEGITAPGEDSYGPLDAPGSPAEALLSVWSGLVLAGTRRRAEPDTLAGDYRAAARHWAQLADTYPGSARLWRDLGIRASRTATELEQR